MENRAVIWFVAPFHMGVELGHMGLHVTMYGAKGGVKQLNSSNHLLFIHAVI
jgi:hypothetical protein